MIPDGFDCFVPGYGEVRGAPMTRCGHQTRPEIDAGVIRSQAGPGNDNKMAAWCC